MACGFIAKIEIDLYCIGKVAAAKQWMRATKNKPNSATFMAILHIIYGFEMKPYFNWSFNKKKTVIYGFISVSKNASFFFGWVWVFRAFITCNQLEKETDFVKNMALFLDCFNFFKRDQ